MKKFISVILAVCLAMLSMLTFAACDSEIEPPQENGTYYAYDAVTEEYNDKDCMDINGGSCKLIADLYGMQMTLDCTVEYKGSSIVVRGAIGEGENGMNIVMYGEKEATGVLRFFRQEVTSGGIVSTQYIVEYYCKKGCAPKKAAPGESDGVYYEYDPSTKQYDNNSTVTINGSACKFSAGMDGLNISIDANGTATFIGKSFILDCTGFGVRMVYMGVKEKDGVLRVDAVTTTVDDDEYTETTVLYYCKNGVAPDKPIISENNPSQTGTQTVIFDANGGEYYANTEYSDTTYIAFTDLNGKVTLPYSEPKRKGYVFVRYDTKQDGTGSTVDKNTKFDSSVTVYAQWTTEVTVRFKNNNLIIASKKVGKGMPLGDFTVPDTSPSYVSDKRYFKGWFCNGKQYVSTTPIEDDITLTAVLYSESDIQKYVNSLKASTKPGHIYIHYWRNDHIVAEEGTTTTASAPLYSSPINSQTYNDWLIWATPGSYGSKNNGRPFYPMKIDMSGAVYDIDTTYIYHDAGEDRDLDTVYSGEMILKFTAASSMNSNYWITDSGENHIFDFNDRWLRYDHVFFVHGEMYSCVYYDTIENDFF